MAAAAPIGGGKSTAWDWVGAFFSSITIGSFLATTSTIVLCNRDYTIMRASERET